MQATIRAFGTIVGVDVAESCSTTVVVTRTRIDNGNYKVNGEWYYLEEKSLCVYACSPVKPTIKPSKRQAQWKTEKNRYGRGR